jgi:hypothetical protein
VAEGGGYRPLEPENEPDDENPRDPPLNEGDVYDGLEIGDGVYDGLEIGGGVYGFEIGAGVYGRGIGGVTGFEIAAGVAVALPPTV